MRASNGGGGRATPAAAMAAPVDILIVAETAEIQQAFLWADPPTSDAAVERWRNAHRRRPRVERYRARLAPAPTPP